MRLVAVLVLGLHAAVVKTVLPARATSGAHSPTPGARATAIVLNATAIASAIEHNASVVSNATANASATEAARSSATAAEQREAVAEQRQAVARDMAAVARDMEAVRANASVVAPPPPHASLVRTSRTVSSQAPLDGTLEKTVVHTKEPSAAVSEAKPAEAEAESEPEAEVEEVPLAPAPAPAVASGKWKACESFGRDGECLPELLGLFFVVPLLAVCAAAAMFGRSQRDDLKLLRFPGWVTSFLVLDTLGFVLFLRHTQYERWAWLALIIAYLLSLLEALTAGASAALKQVARWEHELDRFVHGVQVSGPVLQLHVRCYHWETHHRRPRQVLTHEGRAQLPLAPCEDRTLSAGEMRAWLQKEGGSGLCLCTFPVKVEPRDAAAAQDLAMKRESFLASQRRGGEQHTEESYVLNYAGYVDSALVCLGPVPDWVGEGAYLFCCLLGLGFIYRWQLWAQTRTVTWEVRKVFGLATYSQGGPFTPAYSVPIVPVSRAVSCPPQPGSYSVPASRVLAASPPPSGYSGPPSGYSGPPSGYNWA